MFNSTRLEQYNKIRVSSILKGVKYVVLFVYLNDYKTTRPTPPLFFVFSIHRGGQLRHCVPPAREKVPLAQAAHGVLLSASMSALPVAQREHRVWPPAKRGITRDYTPFLLI